MNGSEILVKTARNATYQVLDRLDAPAHAPHIVEPHHPVLHVEQRVRAAQRFLRLRVLNVTLKQRRYLKTAFFASASST